MTVADLPKTQTRVLRTIEDLIPGDKVLLPVPVSSSQQSNEWVQGWLQHWRYLGRTDATTLRFATRDTSGDTKDSQYPDIFDLQIGRLQLQEVRSGETSITHSELHLDIRGKPYARHIWSKSEPTHIAIYKELNYLLDVQ